MIHSINLEQGQTSFNESEEAPELEVYFGEVERALGKLKVSLPAIENSYKE